MSNMYYKRLFLVIILGGYFLRLVVLIIIGMTDFDQAFQRIFEQRDDLQYLRRSPWHAFPFCLDIRIQEPREVLLLTISHGRDS
jgi:hypothetical protein